MKRLAQAIFSNLFCIPGLMARLDRYARNPEKYSRQERMALIRTISDKIRRGGKISLVVSGTEHFPAEGGFLICPNHQGLFDALAVAAAVDFPLSPVLKKEIMSWPVVWKLAVCADAMPMDRGDLRQSVRVMRELQERERFAFAQVSGLAAVSEAEIGVFDLKTKTFRGNSFKGTYEVSNLTANLTIYTMQKDSVLVVPLRALRFTPEGVDTPTSDSVDAKVKTLWVPTVSGPQPKQVTVGSNDGIFAEVSGDIQEGDQIITAVELGVPSVSDSQTESNPFMPGPPGRDKNKKK